MNAFFWVRVKKPVEFIRAGLKLFPIDCALSLEGDLSRLDRALFPGASHEPTPLLPRVTISPVLDFLILPVTAATLDPICRRVLPQVGLKDHVIHVQIASAGRLILGAYDNFHRDCVWIDATIGQQGITSMLESGIIGWRQFRNGREQQS